VNEWNANFGGAGWEQTVATGEEGRLSLPVNYTSAVILKREDT